MAVGIYFVASVHTSLAAVHSKFDFLLLFLGMVLYVGYWQQ